MFPVEIDALVAPAAYGSPQRRFDGVFAQRVLTRVARLLVSRPDLNLDKSDVFVGSANGIRIMDGMADLALVASIVSASMGTAPEGNPIWLGEVSLTGQVRGQSLIAERAAEAARLGFDRIICPESAASAIPNKVKGSISVDTVNMVEDVPHRLI